MKTTLVTRLPVCLTACSALAYFLASDGIRNHLLLLLQALATLLEHWR